MESLSLRLLYGTPPGRALLKLLTRPGLSRLAGRYLDSRASRWLIPRAARAWHVDPAEFEPEDYPCFNAFFARRRRGELLRFDADPAALVSPCDGYLSSYRIAEDSRFFIKGSAYTPAALLGDATEADRFRGGDCLIFRLAPDNYHRYYYIDAGTVEAAGAIPGILHCVRPIACERYPVYVQNSREYALIRTENFGTVAQIEIGALLVGRIANHPAPPGTRVARGQEKGRFEYGGSTVVLLFEPGKIALDAQVLSHSELPVRTGAILGQAAPAS